MHDSLNITSPAPNEQYIAHFAVAGEIRFGPLYFSLSIDGYSFGQRIFGDAHLWSPASNLLAVQEWLTIDYAEGPITALVLIDLHGKRETVVARATKGFIVPEVFDGPMLVYRTEYAGQGVVEHCDMDIGKIKEWVMFA